MSFPFSLPFDAHYTEEEEEPIDLRPSEMWLHYVHRIPLLAALGEQENDDYLRAVFDRIGALTAETTAANGSYRANGDEVQYFMFRNAEAKSILIGALHRSGEVRAVLTQHSAPSELFWEDDHVQRAIEQSTLFYRGPPGRFNDVESAPELEQLTFVQRLTFLVARELTLYEPAAVIAALRDDEQTRAVNDVTRQTSARIAAELPAILRRSEALALVMEHTRLRYANISIDEARPIGALLGVAQLIAVEAPLRAASVGVSPARFTHLTLSLAPELDADIDRQMTALLIEQVFGHPVSRVSTIDVRYWASPTYLSPAVRTQINANNRSDIAGLNRVLRGASSNSRVLRAAYGIMTMLRVALPSQFAYAIRLSAADDPDSPHFDEIDETSMAWRISGRDSRNGLLVVQRNMIALHQLVSYDGILFTRTYWITSPNTVYFTENFTDRTILAIGSTKEIFGTPPGVHRVTLTSSEYQRMLQNTVQPNTLPVDALLSGSTFAPFLASAFQRGILEPHASRPTTEELMAVLGLLSIARWMAEQSTSGRPNDDAQTMLDQLRAYDRREQEMIIRASRVLFR